VVVKLPKRNIFSSGLNCPQLTFCRKNGRLFHTREQAAAKLLKPKVLMCAQKQ